MAHIGDNVGGGTDGLHAGMLVLAEESKRQGDTLKTILEKLSLLERALGEFTTLHAVQRTQMEHDRARIAKAEESIAHLGEKYQILERRFDKAENTIQTLYRIGYPIIAAVAGLVLSALRDKLK